MDECCHHWQINGNNFGECQKCHEARQFPGWSEVPKNSLSVGGHQSFALNPKQAYGVYVGKHGNINQ